jgi:hypothetical protein
VPAFSTFVTVPRTPWRACFVFGAETCVVVPATPPVDGVVVAGTLVVVLGVVAVLVVVVGLDETVVVREELTVVVVVGVVLVVVAVVVGVVLVWTDGPVVTVVDVLHAAAPALSACTSGLCLAPGHETLCGWLFPGP